MKIGCCVSLWEEMALQLPAAGADYGEGGIFLPAGQDLGTGKIPGRPAG